MIELAKTYPLQTGASNPILRQKAEVVEKIDHSIKEFCAILMDKMFEYKGVGLAAPQIGVSKRIIAITLWKKTKKGYDHIDEIVMINPEITYKSEATTVGEEGCLSLPGIIDNVCRHKEITVSYKSPEGQKFTQKFTGLSSVIIQHEVDHLDGILFIDKVA